MGTPHFRDQEEEREDLAEKTKKEWPVRHEEKRDQAISETWERRNVTEEGVSGVSTL